MLKIIKGSWKLALKLIKLIRIFIIIDGIKLEECWQLLKLVRQYFGYDEG